MKLLSTVLLIVIVGMASAAMSQEKGIPEGSKQSSFQPKPLDDEWSKWLVGTWEVTGGGSDFLGGELEGVGESNVEGAVGFTIELGLNGQFVIWESWAETGKMTDEQKKQVKEALGKYVSDEELERFVSMPYRSLLIQTIDPKTGERIAYCYDSQRLYGQGRGRLEGNKEVMEWKWSGIGQGVTSVSIMEKIDENRLTISMTYTLPRGRKMEEKVELTRKKERSESATRKANHTEDLAAVKQIAKDSHAAWLTDDPEALLALHADDAAVVVSMASSTTNQEDEMPKKNVAPSFQPEPLDDEWSKWLVGMWEASIESDVGTGRILTKIELGLNAQFLIMKTEAKTTEITDEQRQYLRETLHASDEELETFQRSTFKELQIHTIDPQTGEIVGYLFDSMRCIAKGRVRRQGDKEIIKWKWSAFAQGATSLHIMERINDNKFTVNHTYTLPNGKKMEAKGVVTRKITKAAK